MNKRHKLLRRVFSTVMALVLAVSLLPTYAFAASVPTSTTTDGNAADFTGAWKSAHYKPGTYTVTANLSMPGQYNPILTGVTVYANNPDNPFGATDPDDPCENVNTGAAPTTPLKDNATLTVKEDGTLELNLGIHNPIFTTQKVGTCSNLAYTATRLEKTYTSGSNSINGRVYKLDATLGKVDLDANGVATYNFKGSELYALPLALTFKPDGDIALQLTVDLSTIPLVADYSAVTAALAKVPTDLSIYTDETAAAVTAAVNAVVYDKTPDQQAEVDAMAKAIEDAAAALVKKGGAVDPDPTPDPAPTKPTRTQPLDLCIGAETGKGVCESKHTSIDMLSSEGWKWEQNADGKGGTLTLRNFYLYGTPEGAAAANAYNHMWLCMSGEVTVILEGTNIIEINDPYFSAIIGTHCGEADDLHMTIKEGTPGASLEVRLADGLKLSGSFPYATAQSFKLESGTVKTNMYMGPFGAKTVEVAGGLLDIDISETAKLLPDEQIFGITSYNTALVVSGGKLRVNGGNFAGIYDGTLPALAEEQAPSLTVKGSGSLELSGADYGAYIAGGDITIDTTGDIVINAPEVGLITSGSIYVNNVGSYTNTAAKGLAVTSTSTGGVYGRFADYTAVDAALAKVPADLTAYTQDTADAVTAAVSAVIRGKIFLEQAAVDRMAADLEAAIAALKPVPTEVSGTSSDGKITATVRKVDGKTGIDLSNTTVEVVRMAGTLYGNSYNRGYAVVVKVNGALCQNWVAGENTLSISTKLEDGEILGQLGTWIWANGNYTGGVNAFKDKDAKFSNYTVSEDGVATVEVIPATLKATSTNNATCNRLLQEMDRASTAAKATPIGSGDRTSYIGLNTRKTVEPVVTNFFADGQAHAGLKQGSAFKVRVDGVLMAAHYVEATRVIDGVTDTYKYGLYTLDSDFAKQTAPGTYSVKVYIDNSKVVYDNYTWADGTTEPKTITWIIGEKAAQPAAVEGLVYNGESQTGVAAGEGYTLTGETAINAGSHTATATLAEGYLWEDGSAESVEISYTIAKADPAVSVDALTAAFGQKLSDLTLPDGFAWVNGDTELTTVGELTFPAVYTPADTENYNTAELSVTVNVLPEAAAVPAAIEGLVYNGKSQTGVTTGLGYTLTGETAVNAGTHTATAALLPGYAWADGSTDPVEITYTIAKADPTVTRGDFNVPYGTKLGELTLEEGFAWAEGTDLETALTEGTYPVTLIYTPADTENYNTLTLTVNVIVAANEIGAPVIADGSDTEWAYGSSSGLTTKVSGNPGALLSVAVDGTEISDANYTVGDDTVVLNPSYLQTLAKGEHTLTLNYEGGSVSTTFTVKDGTKEVLVTRLKPGTYTITANIWFDKADSGLPMNPHLTNSSFPPKDPVTDNATLRVDANGRALVTVPIVIQSKVMTIQKIKGLNIVDSTRDANGNLTSVTVDLGVLENFSDVITKLCTISLKMGDLAMSISGFDRDQTWRAHFQVNLAGVPTEQVTKTISIGQDGTEVAPETGDSSSVTLFAGMMTVSVLAAVLVCSRKRREENAD